VLGTTIRFVRLCGIVRFVCLYSRGLVKLLFLRPLWSLWGSIVHCTVPWSCYRYSWLSLEQARGRESRNNSSSGECTEVSWIQKRVFKKSLKAVPSTYGKTKEVICGIWLLVTIGYRLYLYHARHIQNVERQNVDTTKSPKENVDLQNVDYNKTSTTTNVEKFIWTKIIKAEIGKCVNEYFWHLILSFLPHH
jgi:hypothetical protein